VKQRPEFKKEAIVAYQLKCLLLLLFCLSFSKGAYAQSGEKVQHLSLDGEWEIIFDHQSEGRIKRLHTNAGFEAFPGRRNISVPSCWEEIEQDYEGVAYYRKTFQVPQEWEGQVVYINFDAVNYLAEVWLNGKVIDVHEGGFTPFSFRLDKSIKFGQENVLTMRVVGPIILQDKLVDNMGRQETAQWRGGIVGGIWQPVSLNATGALSVADVFLETDITDGTVDFAIDLKSHKVQRQSAEIRLSIHSSEGEQVVQKKQEVLLSPGMTKLDWSLPVKDAKLWSPDSPSLYQARIEVRVDGEISDRWTHRFGFRHFTIEEGRFVLNGQPMFLKATFFEGLYPVRIAYPDSKEMAIKEITLAKEAGFNMIRPWRKPPPKMWLDLCDSLGVLTVGSLVLECMDRPISTPYLAKRVELEVRESILRDRNRTCVVQWELFNEANRPVLQQMMHDMSVLAQELDPSRLILDESGGTKGANMYLPYQDVPIQFNDIHYYAGGQVNEKQFNRTLIIGKTKEEIEELGMMGLKMPGRNVKAGLMSYLSELGYASWPSITANNASFRSEGNRMTPAARSHERLEKQVREAFQVTGFDKVFPDLDAYCLEEQKIHGIANKRIIEAARSNPDISGYCIHALTDGDWILGAAIVDLWRNPKTLAYDMTREANQPQLASIRVLPRNIYADEGAELLVTGINELAGLQAQLTIQVEDQNGAIVSTDTFSRDYVRGISELYRDSLDVSQLSGSYLVQVLIHDQEGRLVSESTQSFDVFPNSAWPATSKKVAVLENNSRLTNFLTKQGVEVIPFSSDLELDVPVVVGDLRRAGDDLKSLVKALKPFVQKGGFAIFLDINGSMMTWGAPNPKPKPKDPSEHWRRSVPRTLKDTSLDLLPFDAKLYGTDGNYISRNHIVTDHPIFSGLPTGGLMSGVYENVCAVKSIVRPERGQYLAGVITYDQNQDMDIMKRHYNGIGDVTWAADVLLVEEGKGAMLFSTMQLLDNLGKDPVADLILKNMISYE
ncbi:MAG: hypothetical protein HRT61_19550, partial [Ekhidna sp.]|nr:hypothetical protein [Ekhidna sp.]